MDPLLIAEKTFQSRLLVGTGKFSSPAMMRAAVEASGAEIVTVALRRVDFRHTADPTLSMLDRERITLLPNTSGARDAEEAVRVAKLGRAISRTHWVKLEVTPDPRYLLPDPVETLKAAEKLIALGFVVLPYINADPVLAKRLEEAGAATVMPLGAPIGTNQGLRSRDNLQIIIEQAGIPVVVDAGLGAPSHAAEAMEMGADAVLVNTALAISANPKEMALAFKLGVEAGRRAYMAGLPATRQQAQATSPLTGFLREEGKQDEG